MDNELFLQQLRDLPVEEGKTYIQARVAELADHAASGVLIADEALRQLYTAPFVSLKISELLIFFGEYLHHALSHALGLKAKGDALRFIGHYQASLECLDAAGEEFLHLGDEVNWAHTRISWILASTWIGRAEEALQEATRARQMFLSQGKHYWACIIDHNTAMVHTRLGRYQDALDLYERVLA